MDGGGLLPPPPPVGGEYHGPGDTVPPGGSGGIGSGPTSAGGREGGSASGSPHGGASTGGASAGPTSAPRPGTTPKATVATKDARDAGVDPTTWETWWSYERDFFLETRRHMDATVRERAAKSTTPGPLDARPDRATVAAIAAPALRRALAEESNPDLLAATLIALARLDGPTTGAHADWDDGLDAEIAQSLANSQSTVAEAATLAVGLRARADGARDLAALLGDT